MLGDAKFVATRSPLETLVRRAQALPPVTAAIVCPHDELALGGALAAADRGFFRLLLVGDERKMQTAAARCGRSLKGARVVPVATGLEAATAAHLAASGSASAIVKGSVHSDVLLHAILAEPALAGTSRLSHVVVSQMPGRNTPVLLSDGAVSIAPALDEKVQIVQNAIDLARKLGVVWPRVAILAAVETVVSSMRATIDAAALVEMAQRGQITGGVVDGPLALDDAISPQSAAAKGLHSPAAGCADILISPDLEAGNMLYKAFDVLLGARFGAIVTGGAVPLVFTSRGDSIDSRVVSAALARLSVHEDVSL